MADNGCDELDRLMSALRVNVPGSTDPLLRMTLFDAVDAHLRRTNAWRYETDITLYQGQTRYELYPPAGTSLVRVMTMSKGGRALSPMNEGGSFVSSRGRITPDRVITPPGFGYDPEETVTEGDVLRYSIFYPTYITFDIPPSETAAQTAVKAIMAITLSPECKCNDTGEEACDWPLDPWMYERYHDDWLYETMSRMYGMPAKPWSNAQLALFYGRRARSKANLAKQEADRGFVHDTPAWRFPRNGWVR